MCEYKMDSVLRKLFSGKGFRKTSTNVFEIRQDSEFCPRGGRVWEGIRAGCFSEKSVGLFKKTEKSDKLKQEILALVTCFIYKVNKRGVYFQKNYDFPKT